MAQGIGGEIEGEALAAELVGQHVAGVAGVGADFEERGHGSDELAVRLDDGGAAGVLVEVVGDGAVGIAQRREVVKLHLGAFDGERLGVYGGQAFILARGEFTSGSRAEKTFREVEFERGGAKALRSARRTTAARGRFLR